MAWAILIAAGIFEVIWAVAKVLKKDLQNCGLP